MKTIITAILKGRSKPKCSKLATSKGPSEWRISKGTTDRHFELTWFFSQILCMMTLSHWSVFQGGLGRGDIQSTSIGHWGSPGLGSWTPPLLHIHYITESHHTGTWLLLPFLRWWHIALSLISTRWSNGRFRLLGRHLGMDERTSPTAQPGKDRCRSLPITPPASLRSHGSRPRPTRHTELLVFPATPTLRRPRTHCS